ncbi:MAG: hypothetical protein H6718_24460 [Polyangiaceae bacterium]|nr:hypothetical protein [Polyangiaceae bacterium]
MEFYCSLGKCEFDVCDAGVKSCEGGAIVTCNEVGDAFSAPTPCAAAQTCASSGGSASCIDWTCEAGATYCEPGTETAIACSPDGLSVLGRTDCAAFGQKCFAGECRDQLCTPGAQFCDGNALKMCDSTGQSASVVTQCASGQYCDPASNACVVQLCPPNTAVCDGSVATTCNAQGSGYSGGGTDCASLGQTCAGGACTSCPSPNTLRDSMRIVEVHYGDPDYAVVRNQHPTCPVNLNGLGVRLAYVARVCSIGCFDSVKNYNVVLTNQEVPPGGTVYITEKALSSADIAITSQLDWGGDESGGVRLCDGACDPQDGSNTYDVVLVANATTQVTAPAPVTFNNPISGINAQNQFYTSYVRAAFDGLYPAFQGGDWTTGPATRPSQ